VIYAMLLVALAWTAVSLTRGWSLKLGEAYTPETAPMPAPIEPITSSFGAPSFAVATSTDSRISSVASSILRETATSADRRIEVAGARHDPVATTPPGGARAREGLGQTFRAPRETRALTGTLGS
jgi:type IV secretion system protein VirB6